MSDEKLQMSNEAQNVFAYLGKHTLNGIKTFVQVSLSLKCTKDYLNLFATIHF